MLEERQQLTLPDGSHLTTLVVRPESPSTGWQLLYAPGAGSKINDPLGAYMAGVLAERGVSSVRLQCPYMERQSRRPDTPAVLRQTWLAALGQYRTPGTRIIVSGRSMGGRIASEVVARGASVDGLALFAYPLYPTGHPERRRDKHLAAITVPTLFCSGTRDTMSTIDDLVGIAAGMPLAALHVLSGADHGFSTLASSGQTRQEVWHEAVEALWLWVTTAS